MWHCTSCDTTKDYIGEDQCVKCNALSMIDTLINAKCQEDLELSNATGYMTWRSLIKNMRQAFQQGDLESVNDWLLVAERKADQ